MGYGYAATLRCRMVQARSLCSNTSAISRYGRIGDIHNARKVFDNTPLPQRTIASWNAMVSAYFESHKPRDALLLFDQMPQRNTVSFNGMISGYVKNGMVADARKVFDVMPERNVVSWTSMVRGYVQEGMVEEAEKLFWEMPHRNVVSWTVMIGGLLKESRIDDAKKLFDMIPEKDVVVVTNMIGGYCQVGRLDEARELFDEMKVRNVFTWTTMVSGYAKNGRVDVARKLFEVMPERNEVSWTAMLMGYTQSRRMKEAFELFEAMPVKWFVACNEMILQFGLAGEMHRARMMFEGMKERDEGTWNAMIKVCERKGLDLEALDLFARMQREGVALNFPSMISVLSVCASLASLDHGRQVHARLVRSEFDQDLYVASVLITMYVKCGDLVRAKGIFNRFLFKDVVMWNSMITGYSQHGLGEEALNVFHDMCSSEVQPDEVTFIGVLSACSYSGKVKEGFEIFEAMKCTYQVEPGIEHYACMVDLLGRAGRVDEAMELVEKMPMEPDAIVWGALLGACRNHMKLDLAEVAVEKLAKLEPKNAGPYVLLSHMYATKGRWRDVEVLRKKINRRVIKFPGCSWIEVEKKVHMFTGGDSKSHPEQHMITQLLEKLSGFLREAGYCPDGSFVLHGDIQACEERYNKSKLVHSIMRHVAETLNLDLEDLYVHIGWPLYRKYGHAFEAFKRVLADPDVVLSALTREIKEVGPDGQEVTKVVPAVSEEVKESLLMNIRRRMTPQPLKLRADIEMKCFQFDGVLHIKEAMRKAEAAGNDDCPVNIKLVAPPLYVLTTHTLDKEQGILVLKNAIACCMESIEKHKGKLTVKEQPKVVSERDDKLLIDIMNKIQQDNEEVGGDDDSEEEEDTGMGEVDLDNGNAITE